MKYLSRVAWTEGMYLGPHHFQAQSRFFEDSFGFAMSSVAPNAFGLLECAFDKDDLRLGNLSLIRASGVLPDGTPFNVGPAGDDPPPQARSVRDIYPATATGVDIYVALPARRTGGNILDEASPAPVGYMPRFFAQECSVPDDMLGRDAATVSFARKNLILLAEPELSAKDDGGAPQWKALAIARVVRNASGEYAFDENFVPTCLRVSASTRLTTAMLSLTRTLAEHTGSAAKTDGGERVAGLSNREVMHFWFLHTVNASLARLQHQTTVHCHPETLYLELSRLAGALCTFVVGSSPSRLPQYDHLQPGRSLLALDKHIREHLNVVFPPESIRIPLKQVAASFWEGKLEDPRLLERARWIFGVRSEQVGKSKVIDDVPQVVKICSALWVRGLVDRNLPGLALGHLPVPPAGCLSSPDLQYFSVERSGPCWGNVKRSNTVGVYVPDTLPQPEIELIALFD